MIIHGAIIAATVATTIA